MKFNTPEAVGEVELKRSTYGAEIVVNGQVIGIVDLFYRSRHSSVSERHDGSVVVRIDHPDRDNHICDVMLIPDGTVKVWVSGAAKYGRSTGWHHELEYAPEG